MEARSPDLAAVILAAGAGSRFSDRHGAKLLAELEGRPLLDHVLRSVRAFGPRATVVVVGHGADELERAIDWAGEVRVRNRQPELGLSSSLKVGFAALSLLPGDAHGAFIVLGDQPRLRPDVLHALARAAPHARLEGRAIIVPRYTGRPGARHPVLLLRPAWGLVERAQGDGGLARLMVAHPELVLEVPAQGDMPDVDTPEDLARLSATDAAG